MSWRTRRLGGALLMVAVLLPLALSSCVPARGIDTSKPITQRLLDGIKTGTEKFEHTELDGLLKAHVKANGRVDYAALKKERPKLQEYLARVAKADLATISRDHLFALLINAYNAYTLDLIVQNYPLKSIKDLSKPWHTPFCEVGGEKITLDFLEHQLLRPKETFDDPRIHFAVNCASIGCPLLRPEAYDGDKVETQIEDSTRRCFADERYLKLDGDRVLTSEILKWFEEDFVGKSGSRARFIAPRAPEAIKKVLEDRGDAALGFMDYDWNLNDVEK